MKEAANPATALFEIDLPAQTIGRANCETVRFSIAPQKKNAPLHGIDEITRSEALVGAIMQFEAGATYCALAIPLNISGMA